MTYLPPITPEEVADEKWPQNRNDAWYGKRAEWVRAMEDAGFRVKLKRVNRKGRPDPGSLDAVEEENG